jgi:diguanylate cyclase (GGDEF)-like protein
MYHPLEDFNHDVATLRAVFETVQQSVFVVDARDQRIVDANPAACRTLGIARAELIGCSWASAAARLSHTTLCNVETTGDCFIVLAAESVPIRTESRVAARDALTGLPTREALRDRIPWDSHPEPSSRSALLFIDLDNFKQVNDTWGHVIGDRVLQVVAQRLASCIRPQDLLVRFGGDEFLVLVEGVRRRRDLGRLARRIRRCVQTPTSLAGNEFIISASIGIAERDVDSLTIDALIAKADRDMYRAKCRNRKSAVDFYPAALRFEGAPPSEPIDDPHERHRRVASAAT